MYIFSLFYSIFCIFRKSFSSFYPVFWYANSHKEFSEYANNPEISHSYLNHRAVTLICSPYTLTQSPTYTLPRSLHFTIQLLHKHTVQSFIHTQISPWCLSSITGHGLATFYYTGAWNTLYCNELKIELNTLVIKMLFCNYQSSAWILNRN